MKTVCELDQCTGCTACAQVCAKDAITIQDTMKALNAVIDPQKCVGCGACEKVCQKHEMPELRQPVRWNQGWAADSAVRQAASSGGIATAISKAFTASGGAVCSCSFREGRFGFAFAETAEETAQFMGSKYVKSDAFGIYRQIRSRLKAGQRVLFIGLPCQVGALKKLVGDPDNLYTVDFICHGTPSPKLLDVFLNQYGRPLSSMREILFRVKAKMQIHGDHRGIITKGVSDKYTIAFLNSLTYTENCYSCAYAGQNRVSDITLGDSWGSELPEAEQKKGISLILTQTEKGKELLRLAQPELWEVDPQKAAARNSQLVHASRRPECREQFFAELQKGTGFNRLVFRFFPRACLRQDAKELLLRLKLLRQR